jgi:hypothetical protein
MKADFSSYGYPSPGSSNSIRPSHLASATSHISPYGALSPLPVKSDLLTPAYQQYAVSQFGEHKKIFYQIILKFTEIK